MKRYNKAQRRKKKSFKIALKKFTKSVAKMWFNEKYKKYPMWGYMRIHESEFKIWPKYHLDQ